MSPEKIKYYHAQAAKIDLRRKWQWMATWPIVFKYGERVELVFEYPCLEYRIDIYIPAIRIAIEIDEPHHGRQSEADVDRQAAIEARLGCTFVRLRVDAADGSLYHQTDLLFQLLDPQVNQVAPWQAPRRANRVARVAEGAYTERNLQRLLEAGTAPVVEAMFEDLAALGIDTIEDPGPVIASQGELGFSVVLPGIRFAVSVRANGSIKSLVTQFDAGVPERLGLDLDGPKHGRCDYWTVGQMKRGELSVDETLSRFVQYNDRLTRNRGQ